MSDGTLVTIATVLGLAAFGIIAFVYGYLVGQYFYEVPPCERKHRDEL